MRRIRFQLLAQVPDVDIHDVVIIVGIAPHTFQQVGAREHATGRRPSPRPDASHRKLPRPYPRDGIFS